MYVIYIYNADIMESYPKGGKFGKVNSKIDPLELCSCPEMYNETFHLVNVDET